ENGAEEDEMYQPPARQLRSASRTVKRKVASATKKRSTSTRPVYRRASRAAPPPSDDCEDMWHSPEDLLLGSCSRPPPGFFNVEFKFQDNYLVFNPSWQWSAPSPGTFLGRTLLTLLRSCF
ncbi:hypothetical protein AMECASPLE_023762, partial [Ameca splendens]